MVKHPTTLKRVSPFSDEIALRKAVESSSCMLEVIRIHFPSYKGGSGHYVTLKKFLSLYEIDVSHFNNGEQQRGLRESRARQRIDLEEVFRGEHPSYCRSHLKRRIIAEGILPYQCTECRGTGVWNGKPISLQLDHRNGISTDHRLENLRFLCPNCHSQTPTYAGRGARRPERLKQPKPRPTKISWPSVEELRLLVQSKPMATLGKMLGVSGIAVKRHCQKHGIETPARGYWLRK